MAFEAGVMDKLAAIIWKDLLTEFRTKELFVTMLTFSILILMVFNFALGFSAAALPVMAPAILWISFMFAAVLGMGRSFAIELERGSIVGLLLTPVDRTLLYIGKTATNLVFVFAVELITLPLFVAFFNVSLFDHALSLVGVVVLGTVGFVSVGTLFSAIAANTRLKEIMLPILLFPVAIPVIASSVVLTKAVLNGGTLADAGDSLKLLVSFDIIFLAVSAVVFEYVIEE